MKAPQVDVSYHDLNSLNELRQMANKDKVGAIRQAAKQFESVFMGMLLASMRKASAPLEEGNPLHSNATGFFRDMYDSQLATHLSQSGSLGLADLMVRQLAPESVKGQVIAPRPHHQLQHSENHAFALQPENKTLKLPQQRHFQLDPERIVMPVSGRKVVATEPETGQLADAAVVGVSPAVGASKLQQLAAETVWQPSHRLDSLAERQLRAADPIPAVHAKPVVQTAPSSNNTVAQANATAGQLSPASLDNLAQLTGPEADFVRQLLPAAREAGRQLGLEPLALVAQAALETGWGQKLFKGKDGQSSHNLFGIKAGSQWDGQVAVVDTLEYRGGLAQKEKARFRVYQDFAASMQDYVNLVKTQPRYQDAVAVSHDSKAYFQRLQAAGYATDPNYAEKVLAVLQSSVFKQVRNLLGNAISDAGLAQGAGSRT